MNVLNKKSPSVGSGHESHYVSVAFTLKYLSNTRQCSMIKYEEMKDPLFSAILLASQSSGKD